MVDYDDHHEDDDRTLVEVSRSAIRGKVRAPRDRRAPDKLSLKDWAGYILAVVVPICGVLWNNHNTLTVMEVRVQQMERNIQDLKNWNIALSKQMRGEE